VPALAGASDTSPNMQSATRHELCAAKGDRNNAAEESMLYIRCGQKLIGDFAAREGVDEPSSGPYITFTSASQAVIHIGCKMYEVKAVESKPTVRHRNRAGGGGCGCVCCCWT
jgi:hypothetical protein